MPVVTLRNIFYLCIIMNNTKFATVIHILTILAKNPDEWISSEWIAGSININPVIVRKELGLLQEKGWVISRKGKEGGSKLNIPSKDIRLADIYQAIKNTDVLGKKNANPNPKCPIGKNINTRLDVLFDETDTSVMASLAGKTLEDFEQEFQ